MWRWLYWPDLWGYRRQTSVSTSASAESSFLICKGWMWVASGQTGGVRFLLLLEGGIVLCYLIHVGLVRIGLYGGCMSVPAFENCVSPAKVRVSYLRFQARSNVCCCLIWPTSWVLYEVPLGEFCWFPCHVLDVAWISPEGGALVNKLGDRQWHPQGAKRTCQGGRGGLGI